MINLKEVSSELKNLIDSSQTIAVASHLNPDGDNLGSATAMIGMLNKLGKNQFLFWMISYHLLLNFYQIYPLQKILIILTQLLIYLLLLIHQMKIGWEIG